MWNSFLKEAYNKFAHKFEQPFEADSRIRTYIHEIVEKIGASTIIETGTRRGATAKVLAGLATKVITIEHNNNLEPYIRRNLRRVSNVEVIYGDSALALRSCLPYVIGPVVFYLDAHTGFESDTLHRELGVISEFPDVASRAAFAVHDTVVPGKHFQHNGYSYDELKPIFDKLSPGHTAYYNFDSPPGSSGVMFILPNGSSDDSGRD